MKGVAASIALSIANGCLILFALSVIIFCFIRAIPGDPVVSMFGAEGVSEEQLAAMRTELGLDRPLYVQYVSWAGHALRGDLGQSLQAREPVLPTLLARLKPTVELALTSLLVSTVLGIAIGTAAAVNRGGITDTVVMLATLSGISLPVFWVGLILIVVLSVGLDLFPTSGLASFDTPVATVTGFPLLDALLTGDGRAARDILSHMVLPVATLSLAPLALIARTARASVLEVMHEQFVTAARARGVSPIRVITRHVLRNALVPIVTVIGLEVSLYLGGSIVTETVFSWPGLGRYLMEAVLAKDYPVIQGAILLYAILIVAVNLLVDLAYGIIDPRMRH